MKCPNDQTEMEEGILTGAGLVGWVSKNSKILGMIDGFKAKGFNTWRCSKCGKLEFYTQPDTEEQK